jgi:hypothetical protein
MMGRIAGGRQESFPLGNTQVSLMNVTHDRETLDRGGKHRFGS